VSSAVQGLVWVAGGGLIMRSILFFLLLFYAYTFAGAARRFDPSTDPSARAQYFDGMERAGKLMITIDANSFYGYGYMGYARYYHRDYQGSLEAYTKAIQLSDIPSKPDYLYCRSLAYMKLGEIERAKEDQKAYQKTHQDDDTPCRSFFPGDASVHLTP
jgi:tetratricopeptide (TPR) repeat protein